MSSVLEASLLEHLLVEACVERQNVFVLQELLGTSRYKERTIMKEDDSPILSHSSRPLNAAKPLEHAFYPAGGSPADPKINCRLSVAQNRL